MSTLGYLFEHKKGKLVNKYPHYLDAYESHFSRFKGTDVHLLEIGVDSGGSLDIWRDYFGPNAKIYGADFNPECKKLEEDGFKMFIGSQSEPDFLLHIAETMQRIDILIDDGGHRMEQQITTFQTLFPFISTTGVYVCEDIHTSYDVDFGGGFRKKRSFIEYTKDFIDDIHAWYSKNPKHKINDKTRNIRSIHYYPCLIIIEKGEMAHPTLVRRGERTIPLSYMTGQPSFEEPLKFRLLKKLPWKIQKLFH